MTSPSATDLHPRTQAGPERQRRSGSPTHAVLFDVGYTLLDESARLFAALNWLASQEEPQLRNRSAEQLRDHYHAACTAPQPAAPSLFVQMMTSLGLTVEQARAVRQRMCWDGVPLTPYPDTLAALRQLRDAGLRLGVLANQPESAADDLQRNDVLPLMDDVWLSDAVGLMKPDPAFFQLALDAWQLPPNQIAYVGDRPDNDVRPARALGLYTVLLKAGPHADQPPRDESETPDFIAHSLTDVADHLCAWANGDAETS